MHVGEEGNVLHVGEEGNELHVGEAGNELFAGRKERNYERRERKWAAYRRGRQ